MPIFDFLCGGGRVKKEEAPAPTPATQASAPVSSPTAATGNTSATSNSATSNASNSANNNLNDDGGGTVEKSSKALKARSKEIDRRLNKEKDDDRNWGIVLLLGT